MEIYTGLTLDPVQNVIARTQGLVCVGKRWPNHPRLSSGWKISLRVQLLDPSHLRQEDLLTLWEFLTSRQKDGQVGLMFSGCDP